VRDTVIIYNYDENIFKSYFFNTCHSHMFQDAGTFLYPKLAYIYVLNVKGLEGISPLVTL